MKENKLQKGFTLIELVTVTAIMMILFTAVALNYNSDKPIREVKLTTDELVTVLRKAQSASLTGKNFSKTNKTPGFYGFKYDLSSPNGYEFFLLEAGTGNYEVIESSLLRSENVFDSTQISLYAPGASSALGISGNCVLVLFELPFGKIYTTRIASCVTAANGSNTGITNYVASYLYPDNKLLDANKQLYFRIRNTTNVNIFKNIDINGQTGNIAIK